MLLRRPVPHSRLLRTVFVATVLAVAVGAVLVRTIAAPPGARAAKVSPPGRPPGLVQAGDSKTTCVFAGSDAWKSGLQAANVATGMDFQCLETFSDADPTWSQWMDPWITHADSGIPGWVAAAPTRRTIIVSEDLIPQSLTNNNDPLTWELPCDAGEYNGYATRFARALVWAGLGSAVIRLGKEMNGYWEQDYVGVTASEQHAWARCFAQEVTAMRAVRGADFLFDWNPNTGTNDLPLANFYPGNAYVDIIGADTYDTDCETQPPGPSRSCWHRLYAEPLGLAAITEFAEQRGKPMSIPEWGIVTMPPGLGDDPYYVAGIAAYVETHDVAFQSYFDSGSNNIAPLGPRIPRALAIYRSVFG